MDFIHRLPFIIGAFVTIIIGLVNIQAGSDLQDTYKKMAVGIVVFFMVGLFARHFLLSLMEEVEAKKKELEEQGAPEEGTQVSQQDKDKTKGQQTENVIDISTGTVNFEVGDGEEFTPLKVSEVISRKLEE